MPHILLLEPDRPLAMTYFQGLTAAGYSVTPTASAQAAILATDQRQPDIVIAEMQLTGHSGIEFLYEFRSYSEWQNIPVIMHSQVPPHEFAANEQLLRQQLGVQHLLYKPQTTFRQLLQVAGKCLTVAV